MIPVQKYFTSFLNVLPCSIVVFLDLCMANKVYYEEEASASVKEIRNLCLYHKGQIKTANGNINIT